MPNIGEPSGGGGGGDIQFLSKKEFDGKVVKDEGSVTATGDIVSLTASSGKDMYLAKAMICIDSRDITAGNFNFTCELKVNGVIVETIASRTTGNENAIIHQFAVTGLKVSATQIIKIEAITVGTEATIHAALECWEEDTGVSPDA